MMSKMDGIMPITFHMYSTLDGRLKYRFRVGCAHELKPSADVKPYTSANILKILIWHTARVINSQLGSLKTGGLPIQT